MLISEYEWNRMIDGKLYSPWKVGGDSWGKVHEAQKRFNESEFWHDRSALEELKKCFGKAGSDMVLTPPVYFDHGNRTFFGEHFYANTGLTILDENYVRFGDNVFLAPHVSIYTAGHPIAAEIRNTELEYAKPVTIGSNVWIGGNVVINPGVTIGDDVVIGSGAVVTKDIPSHVIAAGNPCRVIREITEKDRQYWKEQYHNYIENDGESFVSEFCDVFYVEDKNVVFVNWKKYCELEQYRTPLEWALKVIKEHKGCNYVADTRNGFEDNPLDTKWVAEYFMPKAKEYGCQMIYFIIDKENSLKEELEGQAKDSSGLMEFKYVYGIDEVI